MKKKLLALLLVCVMALATSLVAFAGKDVSGREAVTADPSKVLVIDVRKESLFDNGNGSLKNAESWPLFDDKGLSTEANDNLYLAENFKTKALERKTELTDKEIYILCNSGASGAKLATEILTDSAVGYDANKIHTITNGAKGLEVKYGILNNKGALDQMVVSPSKAEKDLADGAAIVIDVRTATNNKKASLAGSIHVPVFDENTGVVQTNEDPLAVAFKKYAEDNKATLEQKPIYILCNSGQSGARAATVLLDEAGLTDVYTITGGAAAIENIEFRYGMLGTTNTVSAADAVASIGNSNVVVIDVRNNTNYNKGYLEGTLHIPVFTETEGVVKTTTHDLAEKFVKEVQAKDLANQKIYILCNSGQSGARAATVLLTKAGYDLKNIYTITGGAGAVDSSLKTTYRFVDGATAIKAAKEGTAYVIDVRSNAARKNVNLDHLSNTNVIYLQLFDEKNSLQGEDAEKLADAFTKYVTDNKATLEQKPIYILCNSGASGARRANELLGLANYDITASQGTVYTIKYGAKGIDVYYSYLEAAGKLQDPVSGTKAVEAVGNDKILILNVRASGNYGAGHLKGAFSLPVFSSSGVVKHTGDSLAQAFTTYVKENKAWFDAFDEIYIVCNSGASGAKAATVLLNDAKVDAVIRTVTGGAKGTDTVTCRRESQELRWYRKRKKH